jgi:hypothetical protein
MANEPVEPNQVLYTVPATTQAERDAMDAARAESEIVVFIYWIGMDLPDRVTMKPDNAYELMQTFCDDGSSMASIPNGNNAQIFNLQHARKIVAQDLLTYPEPEVKF